MQSATGTVLVVRRLDLPEYLVARRVRYRADASTIGEWPHTFWAERFEIGMTREFTDAMRQVLPGWVVCETACGERTPALSLQVELVPLDFWRSELRLRARARMSVSAVSGEPLPPRSASRPTSWSWRTIRRRPMRRPWPSCCARLPDPRPAWSRMPSGGDRAGDAARHRILDLANLAKLS